MEERYLEKIVIFSGSSLIYSGRRLPVRTQATATAIVRVTTGAHSRTIPV